MSAVYQRALLVGTGYIGGSLGLALKRAGRVGRVIGFDASAHVAALALGRKIVDEVAHDPAEAARMADLVILATPVGATAEAAASLGATPARLVFDVGSTKADLVEAVASALPHPERFVGAHPIAGREHHGPAAADPDLFAGRPCVLTPSTRSAPEAVAECGALWTAVGAHMVVMEPLLHDRLFALVSHLPHAAAFALAATVEDMLAADPELAGAAPGLAGGGFADTTRVAASAPGMWRDIFLANADRMLPIIDGMAALLAELRGAIVARDAAAVERVIARAHAGRGRLFR